jgi:hypothetical protein
MKTFALEVEGRTDKNYLVLTLDEKKLKTALVSDQVKAILKDKAAIPTGRIYSTDALFNKEQFMWSDSLPVKSQEIPSMTEIDILCEDYYSLEQMSKALEKKMKVLLDSRPDYTKVGFRFGAFHTFTKSTSLAYSELYQTAKQMLLKGEKSNDIIRKLDELETIMKSPHKSSAKVLKVFALDKKEEELGKVWK